MTADDLTPEELASAYLDGEATPDERALVESDPALLALVATYRGLSRRVAEPVTAPPGRDAAIAAALRAARPAPGAAPSSANIRVLPSRWERWQPRLSTIAGAAAAVVLVAGAIGILSQLGGGSGDDDTASEAGEAPDDDLSAAGDGGAERATEAPTVEPRQDAGSEAEATEAATEEAVAEEAAPAEEATEEPTEEPAAEEPAEPLRYSFDLGQVETTAELRAALVTAVAEGADEADDGEEFADGETSNGAGVADAEAVMCQAAAEELAEDRAVVSIGRVSYQGRPFEVFVLGPDSAAAAGQVPPFIALELPACVPLEQQ
jgi:hypothetical protein